MAVNILSSYLNASQVPYDAKLYAVNLSDLAELGINSNKAFTYYEDLNVDCVENHTTYVWREELSLNETGGILTNGTYVYQAGVIANGIDYGGRKFNFFPKILTNAEVPGLDSKVDLAVYTDALVIVNQSIADINAEIANKAAKSNVLEKDNTTEYLPTADYHPTTKKFVNDLVNEVPTTDVVTAANALSIVEIFQNGVKKQITVSNLTNEYIRKAEHSVVSVSTSQSIALSTTFSLNIIKVVNPGLTLTILFPPNPVESQICSFTTLTNTVTLIAGVSGTASFDPTFAGAPTAGYSVKYVYHETDDNWYFTR